MYLINQADPPEGFTDAWNAAGAYLDSQVQDGLSWLRDHTCKPFVEHLSFRIENQIFWIFLELERHGELLLPFTGENRKFFLEMATDANVIPCVMPMQVRDGIWTPKISGWGLKKASSGEEIDPWTIVSDELIEMSDWELHDFAIQVVCSNLLQQGKTPTSKCSYLNLDPSIWFEDNDGQHWVVVRSARYPSAEAERPSNFSDISASVAAQSRSGFFAPVVVANAEDSFKGASTALPLYRGHGVFVKFQGLEPIKA